MRRSFAFLILSFLFCSGVDNSMQWGRFGLWTPLYSFKNFLKLRNPHAQCRVQIQNREIKSHLISQLSQPGAPGLPYTFKNY